LEGEGVEEKVPRYSGGERADEGKEHPHFAAQREAEIGSERTRECNAAAAKALVKSHSYLAHSSAPLDKVMRAEETVRVSRLLASIAEVILEEDHLRLPLGRFPLQLQGEGQRDSGPRARRLGSAAEDQGRIGVLLLPEGSLTDLIAQAL
jgi:hypothetical protein